jgi:predicted metal-dependent phosphoesterase TrpH
MRVEFHCHSNASDGSLSPQELAQVASSNAIAWFALSDHDTTQGVDQALASMAGTSRVIAACEVTVRYYTHSLHVLAYLPSLQARAALDAQLTRSRLARVERVTSIAKRLAKLGKPIEVESLLAQAATKSLGRPDIARALVSAGHCRSEKQAFTRFLRDNGPADVPVESWGIDELVTLAEQEGICLALAHPHTLGSFELVREIYDLFQPRGLGGIEGYYGPYSNAQRQIWIDFADARKLVAIGGSDFHGEARPEIRSPGIELTNERVDAIEAWFVAPR